MWDSKLRARGRATGLIAATLLAVAVGAQNLSTPWSGYGHDAQHTAVSPNKSQTLQRIRWQTPVDLTPQYSGTSLLIHYGSPLVSAANTVVLPVKTGATDGFRVEARRGTDGGLKWQMASDYLLPPHNWIPSCGIALNFRSRVYFPGEGGTVLWRDSVDSNTGASGRIAFYGNAVYSESPSAFRSSVFINTPITVDRYGNLFFGFQVTGANPANLQSGLARISSAGVGTFVTATGAAGDAGIKKVAHNCAPALSNDHRTLYVAVNTGNGRGFPSGYLLALDSTTLATKAKVRLKDWVNPTRDAIVPEDGTASPMVGPDGHVYYGVLENPFGSNHARGWLLHFDAGLNAVGMAGAFGWDTTPSVVPATMVPSYHGASRYLIFTKYNNYAGIGGDGVNKIAVLDPNEMEIDPVSGECVMKIVLAIAGPTPDAGHVANFPNAVREWCINTGAVDPATKSILVNNEDGKIYRWDLTTNTLIQPIVLTAGIGEAYTPTLIGVDGTVYAINNAILFAVGKN